MTIYCIHDLTPDLRLVAYSISTFSKASLWYHTKTAVDVSAAPEKKNGTTATWTQFLMEFYDVCLKIYITFLSIFIPNFNFFQNLNFLV